MAYATTVTVPRRSGGRLFRALFNTAAVCFGGALVTDAVYARVYDVMWADFSVWLVSVGMLVGGIAVAAGLIEALAERRLGQWRASWPYLAIVAAVLVVELFNAFVHSRDAYQSVVPEGIILSAVAVVLLLLMPVLGRRAAMLKGSR